MSKETELSNAQINAITIKQWGEQHGYPLNAHRTYARAIIAADRELRRGDDQDLAQLHENSAKAWADVPDATAWVDELRGSDAIDASPERDEKQADDVQMPVVAWYGSIARCHEFVALKQNHVLREFEAREIVPEALVRQSDARQRLPRRMPRLKQFGVLADSWRTSRSILRKSLVRHCSLKLVRYWTKSEKIGTPPYPGSKQNEINP